MNKLPTVSIIIPFNLDRGWLQDAIDSVYSQTYAGPIELLRSDKINPLTYQTNSVSQNINEAFKFVTGDYVKFFAEDDMLTQICIESSLEAIEGYDFIHGNAFNLFEKENRPQYPPNKFPTLEQMIYQNNIHGLTLFYRTEAIRDIVKKRGFWFDESLDCAEEYDVNLWLLKNGYKLGYCDKFLGKYRRHSTQKSLGKQVDQTIRLPKIQAIQNRYK